MWKDLVLRPGYMHVLLLFIGCIGTLMRGTGLEDLLGCAFAGVPCMMNGKAWPKALQALRMVTISLLDEVNYRGITVVDLQAELKKGKKGSKVASRTIMGGLPDDTYCNNNMQVHSRGEVI